MNIAVFRLLVLAVSVNFAIIHECSGYQDTDTLSWVYNHIKELREDKGITEYYRDPQLEEIAQSAGYIWDHSQHPSQSEQCGVRAGELGRTNGCAWVIACADSEGCTKATGWDQYKPVQIWYDWRFKSNHYDYITNGDGDVFGCSAERQSSDGGVSIWCLIIFA